MDTTLINRFARYTSMGIDIQMTYKANYDKMIMIMIIKKLNLQFNSRLNAASVQNLNE
jgi:hypothetical protein